MNNKYLLILLVLVLSCNKNDKTQIHVDWGKFLTRVDVKRVLHKSRAFSLTEYDNVDMGYQYSDDVLVFNSKKYSPQIRSYYMKDSLVAIDLFGTLGPIQYTLDDLKNDSIFASSLQIQLGRKISISDTFVFDGNEKNKIIKSEGSKIFCLRNTELYIYNIY